jgi:molybdopterin synthase catalytic subunit
MAEKMMHEKDRAARKKTSLPGHPVVHRLGEVPRGRERDLCRHPVAASREGFLFLQEFMDELKKDVPIWKRVA